MYICGSYARGKVNRVDMVPVVSLGDTPCCAGMGPSCSPTVSAVTSRLKRGRGASPSATDHLRTGDHTGGRSGSAEVVEGEQEEALDIQLGLKWRVVACDCSSSTNVPSYVVTKHHDKRLVQVPGDGTGTLCPFRTVTVQR